MEIKIDKKIISDALAWIQTVVDRKTTMPILSNVLIEALGSGITLTATDLEVGVIETIQAEVIKEGRVALPARGLYDIVRELPSQPISLVSQPNHWVEIKCAKSHFKLVGMDPADFPNLPKKGDGKSFYLDMETLLSMLAQVDFAISMDETRHNLNGILVETEAKDGKNLLRLVATDGHRLSISERYLKKEALFGEGVILPRKGVLELKKLLEGNEGEIYFWVGKKHVFVEKDSKAILLRLIDGKFPPYSQVVPKNQKKVLSMPRQEFIQSLKRASVVTSDRSQGVRFSVSPGHLEIYANNPDLGEAKEELAIQYKGETFKIGFNASYFLECLNVLVDEQVVLQLNDEVSPCLIRSEMDRGFTHVIMPMRV